MVRRTIHHHPETLDQILTEQPPMPNLLPCGLPPCPNHHSLCAYHGDEPDRCPYCHIPWLHILSRIRNGARHICESDRHSPEDAAQAKELRLVAAGRTWEGRESAHCSHLPSATGLVRFEPLAAPQPQPEQVLQAGTQALIAALQARVERKP